MFQGIFKSAINDANKNYIFGTGSIPIQIKVANLETFANSSNKQQGYEVAEVSKLISTMLTGWDADGNKPKSMSDNYLELILSCDNGFVVKKRLQFPHIIAWQNDSTPYNIADVYKEFSIDNWLKADDFENPDITLVVEPTDEILTTSTANPPEATTEQSGRFYLYYRNLPVGVNRIHIDFHIKTKTEPIDFDLEVIDGMSWKDAQTILKSNEYARINVLLSSVKDVYKFTGTEGNFEDITMFEWNSLYQQIINLKPDNKFIHDLFFVLYESEINELESKTTNISSTLTQELDDEIIVKDNNDNIVVKINEHGLSAKVFLDVPEFVVPSVVEPDDSIVDSGYSSPIGRQNVKRADWSATDKYLYYDFLAHYYDGYINETSSYKVTKRSLGSDASNMGYELFEYDFQPAKYSKVVMLSAGMNTCETGGIWGLATFIKAMMTSNEDGFKFLRENVRFKVLPIICPASFDQATLKYENYNGVAINRNFDYKRSFYDVVWPTKGEYPDSEAESKILKAWLNDNAWRADLYIDCHQDPDAGEDKGDVLSYVICSDNDTTSRINGCMPALANYYKDKGTIPASVTPKVSAWTEGGNVYPKTKYCKDICGIRALMIEQYCASTMYGSDGATINDTFQIKEYVAVLRLYIFAALAGNKAIKSLGELGNFIK